MLTGATIASWLGSEGLKVLIGALLGFAMNAWKAYLAGQAQKQAGAMEVEAADAKQQAEVNAAIAGAAAQTIDSDDVINVLANGAV